MKVVLLTARYAYSGVPLAQFRLARALAARGHDVTFLIGAVNPGFEPPLPEGFRVHVLDKARVLTMLGPVVRYFHREAPEVVFSAGDHLNAVVLLAAMVARCGAKISCSSRVSPHDTYARVPWRKGWWLRQLNRVVMRRADAWTCVSEDLALQYRRLLGDPAPVCVYNIVADAAARGRMEEPVDEPWFRQRDAPLIIAAGALEPWKGFRDLIVAMKRLTDERPSRLVVLGDGSQRGELEALVADLGMRDRVKLPGYVANPLKYFRRADVFVLSSYVEGLPNVLVEAMMCGCTPVATNCPTGPREVLQDGKYGYLVQVGDPVSLAAGLARALDQPVPEAVLREAVEPFTEEAVLARHFELLGIPHVPAHAPAVPVAPGPHAA